MMKWTPERIENVRAKIQSMRDLMEEQESLLQKLEFQISLAEQGIDPSAVKGVLPPGRRDSLRMRVKFSHCARYAKLIDGTEVILDPPIPYQYRTERREMRS